MKLNPTPIRFTAEEHAALARAAEADQRPLSAMARKIIVDWLKERGWLENEKQGA